MSKVVAFVINGIGDHLMALPAMRGLMRLFPELTVVATEQAAQPVFGGLACRRLIGVKARLNRGYHFDPGRLAREIGRCDLFISLVPWHSAEVSRLLRGLGSPRTVGFSDTYAVPVPWWPSAHTCDRVFRIVQWFRPQWRIASFAAPLPADDVSGQIADGFLRHAAGGRKVLAFHNETLLHKRWPKRLLHSALVQFLARRSDFVALDLARVLVPMAGDDVPADPRWLRLPGTGSLELAFALVARSDLFLGADSCMLHAADLQRVAGVGLFGPAPADPVGCREMGFRFARHRHLHHAEGLAAVRPPSVVRSLLALAPSANQPPWHLAGIDPPVPA